MKAIGVDLGGTKIAAGVVDEQGAVLERHQMPSDLSDAKALCEQIIELVSTFDTAVDGVGVGAAGIIDYDNGRYLYGPNTGLAEIDLVRIVSERTGSRVALDNDANCAAWGEHRFGAGRGTSNFLCITLGTGIGGGFVFNGQPYRGAHGGAGEVGHMLVDPSGPACGCGRRGCWEQFASGMALERLAHDELPEHRDSVLFEERHLVGPMVTEAARGGDAFALDVVARTAKWIGWGLASLVNVFEPELIAIAGGIASDWDLFEGAAISAMTDRAEAADHRAMPDVVRAALGSDAGIAGAALLVFGDAPHVFGE